MNEPISPLVSTPIIHLEALSHLGSSIPGMITPYAGQFLFTLCYMQELKGDVVEIGSWQGRSTSFLARAVKESKNGTFFAIDHFKGNEHSKKAYQINKEDLSDLEEGFRKNMDKLGLNKVIQLLNMPNEEAVKHITGRTIRLLFIDGDHSLEGVTKDVRLFFPFLTKGSIVVFDDFAPECPGVVNIAETLLKKLSVERAFSFERTLVMQI